MRWISLICIFLGLVPLVAVASTPPSWLLDITFPAKPKLAMSSMPTAVGPARQEQLYLEEGTRVFGIVRTVFPFPVPNALRDQTYADGRENMLKTRKAVLAVDETIQIADEVGRRYVVMFQDKPRTCEHRSVIIGQEFYQIVFEDNTATFDPETAKRFFDSLRARPTDAGTPVRGVTPSATIEHQRLGFKLRFPGGAGWMPVQHNGSESLAEMWTARHRESGLTFLCLVSEVTRKDADNTFEQDAAAWETGLRKRFPEKVQGTFGKLAGHDAYNLVAQGQLKDKPVYTDCWFMNCGKNATIAISVVSFEEPALRANPAREFLQSLTFEK